MIKKYITAEMKFISITGEKPVAESILTYPQRGEQSEGGDALVKEQDIWDI